MNGSDFFDQQPDGRGGYSGPRLQGPLFVPPGLAIVFQDDNGAFWSLGLARDSAGAIIVEADGKPTIALIQVAR